MRNGYPLQSAVLAEYRSAQISKPASSIFITFLTQKKSEQRGIPCNDPD